MLKIIAVLSLLLAGCAENRTVTARACSIPPAEAAPTPPLADVEPKPNGTHRVVSAYNLVEEQTDNEPCIGSDRSNLCERHRKGEKLCATRAYPLGTRLQVGDWGTCIVVDRTSREYADRVDLCFGLDIDAANEFGTPTLLVTPL